MQTEEEEINQSDDTEENVEPFFDLDKHMNNDQEVDQNEAEVMCPLECSFHEVKESNRDNECMICGKMYKSKASLKRHVRTIHYEDVIRCRFCHRLFDTEVAMRAHIEETHSMKYICSECGNGFVQKCHLNEHSKYKHSSQMESLLNCPFENCGRTFTRKQIYQDHLNQHTQTKPYSCVKCSVCFSSRYIMKRRHEKVCVEGKTFKCEQCEKSFTERRSLTYHIEGAHRPERFVCVCGASYRYKLSLYRHQKRLNH
ncbi:gastrula zinc finger protein XlCGF7.1-like [Mercenaria mercenaria]|uniref:gastrula zinc finger protein XlCGF7.1-like n=1 Tax=Mercenaria mercenaria TaxID=6596 RepID=UPI00234EE614|nr:gastrula zinc finger protein XlCGF7.1-like [Mercenaria mercenaria]